jgi:hypothetical protein
VLIAFFGLFQAEVHLFFLSRLWTSIHVPMA